MGVFHRELWPRNMSGSKALLVLVLVCLACATSAKIVKAQEGVAHAPRLSKTTQLAAVAATAKQDDSAKKTDVAAVKEGSYGKILRTCMNTCGGLCRQLCHKFKHIKVCNGCIRGCNKRCELKEEVLVDFDPPRCRRSLRLSLRSAPSPRWARHERMAS